MPEHFGQRPVSGYVPSRLNMDLILMTQQEKSGIKNGVTGIIQKPIQTKRVRHCLPPSKKLAPTYLNRGMKNNPSHLRHQAMIKWKARLCNALRTVRSRPTTCQLGYTICLEHQVNNFMSLIVRLCSHDSGTISAECVSIPMHRRQSQHGR